MIMGQQAVRPLGRDELGEGKLGRGGGETDGVKLCVVLGGKFRMK